MVNLGKDEIWMKFTSSVVNSAEVEIVHFKCHLLYNNPYYYGLYYAKKKVKTDSFDRLPTEDSTYKIIQSVMEFAAKVMKPMSLLEIDVEREKKILSAIDFVLPLKEEGVCLKVVIQQIFKFYNPRRLIIVSRPDVLDRVSRLIQFWDLTISNCWTFFFVNELTAFCG